MVRIALNYSLRKPLGVVAVISPWNLPLLLMSWKLAPALVCGNTIVAKPSEVTPNTATLLAQVFHETGFPPEYSTLFTGLEKIPPVNIYALTLRSMPLLSPANPEPAAIL